MRIILCKAADPCQSVQLAALFITVNGAELSQPYRHVFIGVRFCLVNLAVMWAVHGFEHELLTLLGCLYGSEAAGAVLGIMTAGHIQFFLTYVGGDDLLITMDFLHIFQEILQALPQRCSIGQP